MKNIVFATANPHKLEEVRAIIPPEIKLKCLSDIGFVGDIPETGFTLEDNALQKARFIFKEYGVSCFADDTGLETEVLNGAPGVFSARYAGVEGSSDERGKANVQKLLNELRGKGNRDARFRTVIAYIDDLGREYLFEGIINGKITEYPSGNDGFGYDPVFEPENYDRTFAQMRLEEKNKISHRARAFKKFSDFLNA